MGPGYGKAKTGDSLSRVATSKNDSGQNTAQLTQLGGLPSQRSGGGRLHILKTDNGSTAPAVGVRRAGQAFRQAAACVIRSHSALGAFYRRNCAQLGRGQRKSPLLPRLAAFPVLLDVRYHVRLRRGSSFIPFNLHLIIFVRVQLTNVFSQFRRHILSIPHFSQSLDGRER